MIFKKSDFLKLLWGIYLTDLKRKVLIGTITRNRPIMLQNLLKSYTNLIVPDNIDVSFLITENNNEKTLHNVIAEFQRYNITSEVIYTNEPALGIASARNHVLNYAIDHKYDILTFADDDEQVEPDWLLELLKERDSKNLDIVGSPVRFAAPLDKLHWWKNIIWRGVNQVNQGAEKRARTLYDQGKASKLKLATGSWMANLDFFRLTGLRFDTSLGQAGGEDWQLWQDAKEVGAQTGWTPYAIAYETIPLSRLKLSYYYRRTRDHARMVYHERLKKGKAGRTFGSVLSRIYKVLTSTLLLPLQKERGLITIAANLGSLVGFIEGAFGKKSTHYINIDGN